MSVTLWRETQKKSFNKLDALLDFLQMSEENRKKVLSKPRFVLNVPLRLAEKMAKNTIDDPLFRQFVPLQDETIKTPGFLLDPVSDQSFRKTEKLLHKYHTRALIVTTSACAMHCRYCFRQNFPYETEQNDYSDEIALIQNDNTLSEVILSGGDPLSLNNKTLQDLLSKLEKIAHLKRIRFHTRFPVGIPERIDKDFLQLLAKNTKQIIFVVHINHAKELDGDVVAALKNVQQLGIPVLNQSVLLKGVNDNEKALIDLSNALVNAGILPYYLHQLDPVQGAGHFSVSEERGKELISYLQKNTSGFAVPRLAKEEPGKASKTY